jgi:predicted metal-dependent hydrolase
MRLRVVEDGLHVTMPPGLPERHVLPFILQNGDWIGRQFARLERRRHEAYRMEGGKPLLLFKGEELPLVIGPHLKRVSLDENGIVLRAGLKAPEAALEDWLKEECRQALLPAVAAAEERLGRRHSRLTLRDQKTRWGSCSSTGALSFNWRLVLAPPAVLDYVACHEVAHLEVRNHSAAFWRVVATLCPGADAARAWLKANQHRLMVDLARLVEAAGN